MRYREIMERKDQILSPNGRLVDVVKSPTKAEVAKLLTTWKGRLRAVLDLTNDTIYICDSWYMYHYQMLKTLGLSEDNTVGFKGMADGIGLYFPKDYKEGDTLNPHLANEIAKLRASRSVTRIWGKDFKINPIDPD